MSLGLNDTMPFGKHAGVEIKGLLTADPSYLAWLREQKKVTQPRFFNAEVHGKIDKAIESSSMLRARYALWNVIDIGVEDLIKTQANAIRERDTLNDVRTAAYSEDWGEW